MSINQSKTVDLIENRSILVEFEPKTSKNVKNRQIWLKFDQFPIKFDQFSIKFEVRFEFGPRFRIGFVATSNRTAGIESQKSIKRRFESD